MVTKEFQDITLSALGMGTMRLPVFDGDDSKIDEAKTAEMVDYAIKNGINYFDTAWGYHSGNSEIVMGKVLKSYPRDSFYLASKFPGYDLSNMDKVQEIFEKQLEKCGVDYFDFYLFHNVCEMNIDAYLDEKYGIFKYLTEQKENGRIRHLGFSIHGNYEILERFLKAYGDKMEFCQIQLNYIDWSFQNAKAKVELLNKRNIPVWVMEPLRGGKLAELSEDIEEKLTGMRPEEEIPAWAFRFLQSIEGVTMILSGMSDFKQVQDNIKTFSTEKPLSKEEMDTLLGIADGILSRRLPCTACHYCTSHCPKGLDIPGLIKLYNEHNFTGGGFIAPMALMAVPEEKHPSACIGCRSCEAVCPQQIKISEAMSDFANKLANAKDI
ncbi:MAG: aldo/keto reductase [Lachnospiraceae bacterium]